MLVETVGVGQSEVTVAGMVDTFLFLTLARTGDQLQGIKKGILEIADVIAVNKADGDREQEARVAARELAGALRLVRGTGRVGAAGAHLLRRCTDAASTTSGSGCWRTASHLGDDGLAASAPSSSSTSPGRWSATSSTSGCAARPAWRADPRRGTRRRARRRARRRRSPPTGSSRRTTSRAQVA